MRDLRRQLGLKPVGALHGGLDTLVLVSRLLHQPPKGSGKIYALHEPHVDCISKGKARVRYEFGTKGSIATTMNRAAQDRRIIEVLDVFKGQLNLAFLRYHLLESGASCVWFRKLGLMTTQLCTELAVAKRQTCKAAALGG